MKLTVRDLLDSLKDAPLDAEVMFQANVTSGDEGEGEEPGYTTDTGYVYSGFLRNPKEFVIDGAITQSFD